MPVPGTGIQEPHCHPPSRLNPTAASRGQSPIDVPRNPTLRVGEAHEVGALGREPLSRRKSQPRIVAVDDAMAELDFHTLDEVVGHEIVEHGAGAFGHDRAGEIRVCLRALVHDRYVLDPEPAEWIVHANHALRRQIERTAAAPV